MQLLTGGGLSRYVFPRSPFTHYRGQEPMRRISIALLSIVTIASTAVAQDAANKVAGGGIKVAGWQGTPDKGQGTVNDALFEPYGNGALHAMTGPAITYWNLANKASGNYT